MESTEKPTLRTRRGQRTCGAADGASFLFLARRESECTSTPDRWLDEPPFAEGQRFCCGDRPRVPSQAPAND